MLTAATEQLARIGYSDSAGNAIVSAMSKIYLPSHGPEDWKALLADPEKHWRSGYSARTLAACWEAAQGLPPEISRFFLGNVDLLLALPEHKVPIPPRGRDSQNDVFVLVRHVDQTVSLMIEGKVEEPFGPLVGEWLSDGSEGKRQRLGWICEQLGLDSETVNHLRYQLLHRTVSAIIEMHRFKTDRAAMIVHSFSRKKSWYPDFEAFVSAFDQGPIIDDASTIALPSGESVLLAWATGDFRFLAA